MEKSQCAHRQTATNRASIHKERDQDNIFLERLWCPAKYEGEV